MKKANLSKSDLRKFLTKKRNEISLERKREAAEELSKSLPKQLPEDYILSFASLPEEIDLWDLNQRLAQEKRLLLPKREGDVLEAYFVEDLKNQLNLFYGRIQEPIALCPLFPVDKISCILVPGLGFDRELFRIGYGKGYYDRLLKMTSGLKIGIGFQEQLIEGLLPREAHDVKMDTLALF
jgi:5-formyltetrahydrofolate cyclo-ligase